MEGNTSNTNPVPSIVIGYVSDSDKTVPTTATETTEQVSTNQQATAPSSDSTTTSPSENTTTGTSTDNTTTQNTENKTSDTTQNQTSTETISNTATTSSTRTISQQEMKIATDGTMSIDGKVATNEELQRYFDYTKYTDKESARMVEGIFKSNTVTINGVIYKAELNKNGEMESLGGTRRLTQEEIRSYFGDKGYEALVCKTTKDVSIGADGKIEIKDRAVKVDITIAEPYSSNTNMTNNAATSTTNGTQSRISDPKSKKSKSSAGGVGGGYSGGGGGGYSGGSSGSGSGGGTNSGVDTGEIEEAGTPVIMVDFASLESIRDEIGTLKTQLDEVCQEYGGTINTLSGDSSAWSGPDKDAYVTQKKGYVTNIEQVSSTLNEFYNYLDTCYNNYQTLESELAAKEIS